jgi:hypothetical protein
MTETSESARAEALCDEIVDLLPGLGGDVATALSDLETALTAYVDAALRYDACVTDWLRRLPAVGAYTARAVLERYKAPRVHGLPLRPLRPDAHLAQVVSRPMAQLRGPTYLVTDLQQLGDVAPEFVTNRHTNP